MRARLRPRLRRSRMSGTRGTAAVEFALVLPLLLVLVLGTVEIGFLILSQASMNTTMARVPDLARRAATADDLAARLDELSALRLGLGLAEVAFDPVAKTCVCQADATRFATAGQSCPPRCETGEPLQFYTVTGRVRVPSLIPGGDGGGRSVAAELMVMGK